MDKSRLKVPTKDGKGGVRFIDQYGYIFNRWLFIGQYGKHWRLYHNKSGLVLMKEFKNIKDAQRAAEAFMEVVGDEDFDELYDGSVNPQVQEIGRKFTQKINELKIRV